MQDLRSNRYRYGQIIQILWDFCAFAVAVVVYDDAFKGSTPPDFSRGIGNGILGLSVHDSVIVDTKYEEDLRETMETEYEAVMDYKPVF